jgi:hypothetical protein
MVDSEACHKKEKATVKPTSRRLDGAARVLQIRLDIINKAQGDIRRKYFEAVVHFLIDSFAVALIAEFFNCKNNKTHPSKGDGRTRLGFEVSQEYLIAETLVFRTL